MVSNKKVALEGYEGFLSGISRLLTETRRSAAKSVNSILTTTYWEIGRRIVEFEQRGKTRADYGDKLIKRLAVDLRKRFERGFNKRNLDNMRQVYLLWSKLFSQKDTIRTKNLTAYSPRCYEKVQTVSAQLSWPQYTRLAAVKSKETRDFYKS